MKLICVRHGETNYNILGLCNSFPTKKCFLTKKGIEQAKILKNKLKKFKFDIIYISDLYRTKQTANYINKKIKKIEKSNIGDNKSGFDGESLEKYRKAFYSSKDCWNERFNNGESFEDEKIKISSFLNTLKTKNYKCVLIVTHMSVIRKFYWYFNKDLINEEIIKIDVPNCSIHEFEL